LAEPLDKVDIDVRTDENNLRVLQQKPVLMPLETFNSAVTPNLLTSLFANNFLYGYEAESVLLAVDSETGVPLADITKFTQRWREVEPGKRVFISFSSADKTAAINVESTLNEIGYSTFLYIRGDANGPFNAVDTGNYFREADHRYVIDTDRSRRSNATAVEALAARTGRDCLRQLRGCLTDLASKLCCKRCKVINGRITDVCTPKECGPQCVPALGISMSPFQVK
jgi:hypothetical protein